MKTAPIKSLLALSAITLASSAYAVSFTQNGVTMDINGTVNGFYVNRESKVTAADGSTTKTTTTGISNGLLPGWINFVATAKVDDVNVKAHISFAPGINDSSTIVGLPTGVENGSTGGSTSPFTQIDTRNNYFSFGTDAMGTVKIGRDIGLFAQNIILSDMTLLGVGGTANAAIPFNTTFGMIGHGYMYTGFQAQISYTSPKVSGLQGSVGLFQPKNYAGSASKGAGLQANATYDIPGALPGQIWTGLINQKTDCQTSTACTTQPFTANGFELGGKINVSNFEFLAYGFQGKGLGLSTVGAPFFGGSDGSGNKTDSNGYMLQGTYKMGATKFGLNFGENKDKDGAVGAGVTKKNQGMTLGVYHTLNKFITLVGEYNHEKQTTSADTSNTKNNSISLGGILFF
jgi:hypothetical protein